MNRTDPVRDRLLAVARKLFVQRGYDGVSVRDITSRAKANLGAITYHFGSKQALYHAALESVAAPLVAAIADTARAPGTGLDRVEAIVRVFLDMARGPRVSHDLGAPTALLRELASDRPLPPPVAQAMKRNLGVVVSAITAGQQDGSIRAGDPVLLALSVASQAFFFRVAGKMIEQGFGIDRGNPKARTRLVDAVVDNVRYALATAPRARS